MAARKTKPATPSRSRPKAPRIERAPTAAEEPVTRAMLGKVRDELLERIDQSKSELRAEIQDVRAEVHSVRAEVHTLRAEVHELRSEVHELRAAVHRVEAGLHAVQAEVARIGLLIEEQNARNKVVLDALTALMDRQTRIEQRMDKVEETVRALASARPAS